MEIKHGKEIKPEELGLKLTGTEVGSLPIEKQVSGRHVSRLEKASSIFDTIFGGGKVGEAIGTKYAEKFSAGGQALAQQEAQGAVPMGTMAETFKQPTVEEIAGSALQSAALFTPVGKLAGGISAGARGLGMKTGVSALGKIGSGAMAGGAFDIAQELQGKDSGGIGTAIGAAIPAVGVGINVAGRVAKTVAPKLLSYTSDVPEKAFESMLQRREPVVSAIKAGATPQTALKNTQGAVRQLRTTLSNDWQEGVTAIQNEFTGKRLGLSDKSEASLFKLANEFGFDDKLPQNIKSASVNEWMDTLKAINGLPKLMLSMSPKGAQLRATKKALESSIIKTFGGEKGSVAQLYKNYSAKKGVLDAANDIVNAYSTGKPIQQSTALNRLQTLFNENKPAYLEAILDLEKATGRDLLSEITASKFANKLPTMGTSVSATSGIMAPAGPLDKVIKLMILPLSSPRSAGFIARTLGKVKSPGMPKGISPGDRVLPTLQKGASNINKTMAGKGGLSIKDVSKSPLHTEARKYKTAEELGADVKSKGHILDSLPKEKIETAKIDSSSLGKEIGLDKRELQKQTTGKLTSDYWLKKIQNGERPPILVGVEDGKLKVLDGNHRATAYSQEGIKDVPVIYTNEARVQLTDIWNKAHKK